MSRLDETPEVLDAIKQKAFQNAIAKETYGTKASFNLGRKVASFEETCHKARRRSFGW